MTERRRRRTSTPDVDQGGLPLPDHGGATRVKQLQLEGGRRGGTGGKDPFSITMFLSFCPGPNLMGPVRGAKAVFLVRHLAVAGTSRLRLRTTGMV